MRVMEGKACLSIHTACDLPVRKMEIHRQWHGQSQDLQLCDEFEEDEC